MHLDALLPIAVSTGECLIENVVHGFHLEVEGDTLRLWWMGDEGLVYRSES